MTLRHELWMLTLLSVLAACGGSGGDNSPPTGIAACSNEGQKQFVLDAMRDVYFWNDLLPAVVSPADYAGPDELLDFLISFQPLDTFSFINSAEADSRFFGAGQYQGFGFSYQFVAADDVRFTRVFAQSPAAQAGFSRGQRIIELDGRTIAGIEAAEGVDAVLNEQTIVFTIRNPDNSEFSVSITQDVVTIDPLPQWRVIDTQNGSVGYMEFATFISTADPVFESIFSSFVQASISDLILDLRYNGGGLISTTELLGDYLGGGVANGLVFSRTLFNANNAGTNRMKLFQELGSSLNLSRLIIIASNATASASELVTNSMEPYVEVTIVGDTTFGKPVGQVGIPFCEKILRATAFETVNALDEGGYYDGLPVDCAATDDLNLPVGDDADPNVVTALAYLNNGSCPLAATTAAAKPVAKDDFRPALRRGSSWREVAGAY